MWPGGSQISGRVNNFGRQNLITKELFGLHPSPFYLVLVARFRKLLENDVMASYFVSKMVTICFIVISPPPPVNQVNFFFQL